MLLSVVGGLIGIALGFMSWMGWFPTKRRTSWLKGGAHTELMIMGPGLLVLAVAGLYHSKALGLLGLAIVVAGFVLGLIQPSWLVPRWYKEKYPDPPQKGSS